MTALAKLQFSQIRANFVAAREIHSYASDPPKNPTFMPFIMLLEKS